MTLILSNSDVENLLTMNDTIAVLEQAYVELDEGRGVSRTRSDCLTPVARPDSHYSLKSMDGVIPSLGVSAIRINSDIVTMPKEGNNIRRVKIPAAEGGRYVGLVVLFSSEDGTPLAIMPDGVMQRMRVGASNGLGIKYLARKDASSVGILGSGWQAGAQLMAACAVRDVQTIRCFSPNRERREAFCAEWSKKLCIRIDPTSNAEEAVRNADIVMCASNSLDNIFFERWLETGMHVSSIKNPEIELAALKRADRVVLHIRESQPILVIASNLPNADTSETRYTNGDGAFDLRKVPTLPELINGKAKGRANDQEITCFINNLGLGYQFAAVGSVIYRRARETGCGNEVPTDWFTEDVHP